MIYDSEEVLGQISCLKREHQASHSLGLDDATEFVRFLLRKNRTENSSVGFADWAALLARRRRSLSKFLRNLREWLGKIPSEFFEKFPSEIF